MHTVIINIGSNLGQRRLNLSKAMSAINAEFGDFELSHVVESDPWGYDSENKFLNVGMIFNTEKEPVEVLHKLQEIEHSISAAPHRTDNGQYTDRLIDIDIVAIDTLQLDTPELQLPHPHLAERDFFLVPLEELAPGWIHPSNGMTATQMLEQLKTK